MNRLSKLVSHLQSPSQELRAESTVSQAPIRRIVRFKTKDSNQVYYGIVPDNESATVGSTVSLLNYTNIFDVTTYQRSVVSKQIAKMMAPIDPVNIFCIGLNYKSHAKESEMDLPKNPLIFSKPTSAVIAANESIIVPKVCDKGTDASDPGEMDYEVELVIVIGKRCKNVSERDALRYVLGYSVANDVSARQWQLNKDRAGGQWIRGKSFDTFCPLGPCLLLEDGNTINAQNLKLYTKLNGETVQDSNTNKMIFSIRKLVSHLSTSTTLLPGTVILSGTPQGIGFKRKPPKWLKNGDVVVCGVQGIGDLVNYVKDE